MRAVPGAFHVPLRMRRARTAAHAFGTLTLCFVAESVGCPIGPIRNARIRLSLSASVVDLFGKRFRPACTIAEWPSCQMTVPGDRGVYAIRWPEGRPPIFLAKNPGGWLRGKGDPTMATAYLATKWTDDSCVLYLGMAKSLRDRIDLLVLFGAGHPVRHWAGRALWQLDGIADARIYWLATPSDCELCIEHELLTAFRSAYGKLPYANTVKPRKHRRCRRT
jgi:hypothetical protein